MGAWRLPRFNLWFSIEGSDLEETEHQRNGGLSGVEREVWLIAAMALTPDPSPNPLRGRGESKLRLDSRRPNETKFEIPLPSPAQRIGRGVGGEGHCSPPPSRVKLAWPPP